MTDKPPYPLVRVYAPLTPVSHLMVDADEGPAICGEPVPSTGWYGYPPRHRLASWSSAEGQAASAAARPLCATCANAPDDAPPCSCARVRMPAEAHDSDCAYGAWWTAHSAQEGQ